MSVASKREGLDGVRLLDTEYWGGLPPWKFC